MKKINIILEGISLEIPPLRKDSEGNLRGGFVGMGGARVAVAPNTPGCYNEPCLNDSCINNDCTNINCFNTECENDPCFNRETTTGTTEPTDKGKVLLSGLLI